MAYYTGPFDDLSDLADWGDRCDQGINTSAVANIALVRKGPMYGHVDTWLGYVESCSINRGYYVLHDLTTWTADSLQNRLNGWNDPNVVPPIPGPSEFGGTGTPIQRGTNLPGDLIYFNGDKFGDNHWGYSEPYQVRWLSILGVWVYDAKNTYMRMQWVSVGASILEDICPPGTVYNPNTMSCDVLPGYVWDPRAGELGEGGYVLVEPGMPVGNPWAPGELPPYYTDDPTGDQAGCYVWSEELQVYVYDSTIEGCDGSDCIKAASCIVEPSLDLIPDDIDSILPPGYVDVGSLPGINQPTDSITAGCVKDDSIIECDIEDDVTTKTGCSIIPEC